MWHFGIKYLQIIILCFVVSKKKIKIKLLSLILYKKKETTNSTHTRRSVNTSDLTNLSIAIAIIVNSC